jgi:hypothetical protein
LEAATITDEMDAASESPRILIETEEEKRDSGDEEQMLDWSKIG